MSNYLFKHPVTPLNNVNGNFVNVDGSNWPGRFGSNETSREFALPDNYSCNATAANASRLAPSLAPMQNGGGKRRRTLRKKIKNIVNKYRMASKKMRKQTKRRLLSLYKRKGHKKSGKTRRHRRGGNTTLYKPIVSSQNLKLVNGTNAYNNFPGPVAGVANPYNINSMLGGKRYKKSKKSKKQRGGYHQFQSDIPITQTYSRGGILDAKDLALANPAPYQVLPNCTNCIDNYDYNTNRGFQFWGN
jgi:hypothetical protein